MVQTIFSQIKIYILATFKMLDLNSLTVPKTNVMAGVKNRSTVICRQGICLR